MKQSISIIGSGFSSLASACYLAKAGFNVTVYEKNESVGGRASQFSKNGFTFDMGPTWYWMPDVFERFFADFGKKPSDYYQLEKLSPAYRVYFDKNRCIDIADNLEEIAKTFEQHEKGSSIQLKNFISLAKENYDIAIKDLVYRPGDSFTELITLKTIKKISSFFSNISADVKKIFKNKELQQILEFPVLFLGAKASDTPSFYNFMNYADFGLGTFHPKKGMKAVVNAIENVAKELGVKIHLNSTVEKINIDRNKATSITINGETIHTDIVLSGADYHFTETLLPSKFRNYSQNYWQNKTFAPSALLFYVGFDKQINNVQHHTLFFDTSFKEHAEAIYDKPTWPNNPLFYASFPSKTDDYFAPEGKEAGIFLIPLAPDLKDEEDLTEKYFDIIIERLETLTGDAVKPHVIFKESFCIKDFKERYNSYKGNAYGLANILLQTAFLRPKLQSKKVSNLYFTGQLTVPGPGVPPALISGKLVSEKIIKNHNLNN